MPILLQPMLCHCADKLIANLLLPQRGPWRRCHDSEETDEVGTVQTSPQAISRYQHGAQLQRSTADRWDHEKLSIFQWARCVGRGDAESSSGGAGSPSDRGRADGAGAGGRGPGQGATADAGQVDGDTASRTIRGRGFR